jgi:hypothetical protein
MDRLEVYMHELSKQDRVNCAETGMNIQFLEAKTGVCVCVCVCASVDICMCVSVCFSVCS